ncbi:MAG TPA: hypothetical protein VM348_07200, partial [Brevundimonas sp.]|nr:hypothetical protein [Brevundimonas sp.]
LSLWARPGKTGRSGRRSSHSVFAKPPAAVRSRALSEAFRAGFARRVSGFCLNHPLAAASLAGKA